jgi:hypothetical protein
MKILSLFCLVLFESFIFAQEVSEKLVYTISKGEKIIIKDEHGLLISNNTAHHILFLEKDSMKYIVYDDKKYGPFEEIIEYESATSLLDWAVKKNGKWYQLVLDYDKLVGPFDAVVDVYRDISGSHFGFRAKKDTSWYVVIDNATYGPYSDVESGFPNFSNNGDNWVFEYSNLKNGKSQRYIKLKNEEFKKPESLYYPNRVNICDNGYSYSIINSSKKGWSKYSKDEANVSFENNDGIRYFYKLKSNASESNSNNDIIELKKDNNVYYALYADEAYISDKNGEVVGPFSKILQFGSENCIKYVVAMNYMVKQKGRFLPIYTNFANNDFKFNELPFGDFKNEVKIIVGENEYGPFGNYRPYSLDFANNGHFICVVNDDNELLSDGILTGIKNIDEVKYDDINGNHIAYTKDKEVWFNNTRLGKLNINSLWSDVKFSVNGKDFAIVHKKEDSKFYVYLSTSKESIGPLNVEDENFEWAISDDFKHFTYNTGKVYYQDNRLLDEGGFSLQYSNETNSFNWLNLKGNQVFKKEFKNK